MADLREQLRGEAARIMELQRKAFDSKLVSEAAQQVGTLEAWVGGVSSDDVHWLKVQVAQHLCSRAGLQGHAAG